MIAFLDVDYRNGGARAACVLAQTWTDTAPVAQATVDLASVAAYVPGAFYQRELPCLVRVLDLLAERPKSLVIDGYVWLDDAGRPGLGYHLYQHYEGQMPVLGIAKTAFAGRAAGGRIAAVHRGGSTRPLFVSAVGIDLDTACQAVTAMAGAHRLPSLVSAVDRLARSQAVLPTSAPILP